MFKKIMASILAVAMVVAMSTTVFAREQNQLQKQVEQPQGSSTQEDQELTTQVEQGEQQKNPSTQEKVHELTARLEQDEGGLPADFTLEDMNTFLELADPDTIKACMDKIMENALPMPEPEITTNSKQITERSNIYLSYDCRTGLEQSLTFDISDTNETVQESEGKMPANAAPLPQSPTRAYPDFWFEKYPQNYYDTSATSRVIVKTKDGGRYYASGFLISEDTLVTAAHNIFNTKMDGWCAYLLVYPSHSESSGDP